MRRTGESVEEKRKNDLLKVIEADERLDSRTNGVQFDAFVRERLFWAMSVILNGSGDNPIASLQEALCSEYGDLNDDLLASAWWPLNSEWLHASLAYFRKHGDWDLSVIPYYLDEELECPDVKVLELSEDPKGQLEEMEASGFLSFLPAGIRRAIFQKHLEDLKTYHGWGLFTDDDSNEGGLVVLSSRRLDEYLSLPGSWEDDRKASELIRSLMGCFDDGFILRGDGFSAIVGVIECDGYNQFGFVRPRLFAVGELLDEAMEEELEKTGGIPSEKGEAS